MIINIINDDFALTSNPRRRASSEEKIKAVHSCLFIARLLGLDSRLTEYRDNDREVVRFNDNDWPSRGTVVTTSTQLIGSLESRFEKRVIELSLPGETVPRNDVCTHAAHRYSVIVRNFPMGVANKPVRRSDN